MKTILFLLISITSWYGSIALAQSGYRLGSGDLISIVVFNEDDLSVEVRIGDTKNISYPFLGQISVLDRSVAEIEAEIADGLRDGYLVEPRVSVSVVEYRPFFITGEVNQPGGYPFQPGLTLRKAITLGGGFTERASRSRVSVTRGGSKEARQKMELDAPVFPDDVITVEQSFF